MKKYYNWLFFALLVQLTACFELREEIELQPNGSGKYYLLLDMSQSKSTIDLAMNMQKSKGDDNLKQLNFAIDSTFSKSVRRFNGMKGITNAKDSVNKTDYIFGISFNFSDIASLNNAIIQLNEDRNGSYTTIFDLAKNTFSRSNQFYLAYINENLQQNFTTNPEKVAQYKNLLQTAQYTYIVKVQGKIKKFSNDKAELDYTKKALRLSVPLTQALEGKAVLENEIKFK